MTKRKLSDNEIQSLVPVKRQLKDLLSHVRILPNGDLEYNGPATLQDLLGPLPTIGGNTLRQDIEEAVGECKKAIQCKLDKSPDSEFVWRVVAGQLGLRPDTATLWDLLLACEGGTEPMPPTKGGTEPVPASKGVSVRDVVLADGKTDEHDMTKTVAEWSARYFRDLDPIGVDPKNRRAKLFRLPDIIDRCTTHRLLDDKALRRLEKRKRYPEQKR